MNNQKYIQELKLGNTSKIILFEIMQKALTILFFIILTLIFPLIHKKDEKLSKKINEITKSSYSVYVIKNARYPNAFCFAGFGFGKPIFVTEKLIEMLNERELLAVCLHEVGHIKNYDGIKRLLIGVPLMIASQVILIQMIIKLYELGIRRQSLPLCAAFLTFFGLLLSLSPAMYLARLQEYKADTYASKFGYNKDMISALEKIEKYMESIKRKPNMISKAFSKLSSIISSHPPIQKRIENILQNDELYIAIENKNKKDLKKIITNEIE